MTCFYALGACLALFGAAMLPSAAQDRRSNARRRGAALAAGGFAVQVIAVLVFLFR